MMTVVTTLALVVAMIAAAWYDVRERRIPNNVTLLALLAALALRAVGGLEPLAAGLAGAGIGLALALPFFLVGGLGGGDVKLLVAVGAFLGPRHIWFCLLVMALVGGAMAIVAILRRHAVRQTMANLHTIFATFGRHTFSGWKGEGSGAAITLETPGVIAVPYGVAIAAGGLTAWFVYTLRPEWSLLQSLAGMVQ